MLISNISAAIGTDRKLVTLKQRPSRFSSSDPFNLSRSLSVFFGIFQSFLVFFDVSWSFPFSVFFGPFILFLFDIGNRIFITVSLIYSDFWQGLNEQSLRHWLLRGEIDRDKLHAKDEGGGDVTQAKLARAKIRMKGKVMENGKEHRPPAVLSPSPETGGNVEWQYFKFICATISGSFRLAAPARLSLDPIKSEVQLAGNNDANRARGKRRKTRAGR